MSRPARRCVRATSVPVAPFVVMVPRRTMRCGALEGDADVATMSASSATTRIIGAPPRRIGCRIASPRRPARGAWGARGAGCSGSSHPTRLHVEVPQQRIGGRRIEVAGRVQRQVKSHPFILRRPETPRQHHEPPAPPTQNDEPERPPPRLRWKRRAPLLPNHPGPEPQAKHRVAPLRHIPLLLRRGPDARRVYARPARLGHGRTCTSPTAWRPTATRRASA